MNLIKPATLFYCLVTVLVSSGNTYSQAEPITDTSKWYQVEVFIFANNNPDAAMAESWPQEPGLKYSEPLVMLTPAIDPQALANETNDRSINSGPDPLNYQAGKPLPAGNEVAPVPFQLLPRDQLQLSAASKKILHSPDFRLLFHEAWRQPLSDRANSEQIIILGGELFDQHHELEGTINISVERYLHINTNLWYSTFTSNAGGVDNPWPQLPTVPVSLATAQDTNLEPLDGSPSGKTYSFDNQFQADNGNLYSVERTVTLRQHRRMRSNELHYIDHPLLGMLVKVTPYEPAAAEKSPAPTNP